METLQDINLLMSSDSNFYMFVLLVVIFTIFLIAILYLILKYFKTIKPNPVKIACKKIRKISLKESKNASYKLTKYSKYFPLNPYTEQLLLEIEQYKYQREIKEFSDESIEIINKFIDSCKC